MLPDLKILFKNMFHFIGAFFPLQDADVRWTAVQCAALLFGLVHVFLFTFHCTVPFLSKDTPLKLACIYNVSMHVYPWHIIFSYLTLNG